MAYPYYPSEAGKPHMRFHIVSELNGKVLDIEGGDGNQGAKVIMYEKKKPACENQLWYIDQQGVIRSALNDFALQSHGNGHEVKMHSFNGGYNQQWRFDGQKITNGAGECLDIEGANQSDGANVIAYSYGGAQNQHWRAEHVRFHIVSELNGKVLDIEGGDASPGAKVIMYEKKHPAFQNQLWYVDQQAVIRSALNHFALDSHGNGHHVKMHSFNGGSNQQWRFEGQKITNGAGECLDIERADRSDGAKVIPYSYKSSDNQHWRAEVV